MDCSKEELLRKSGRSLGTYIEGQTLNEKSPLLMDCRNTILFRYICWAFHCINNIELNRHKRLNKETRKRHSHGLWNVESLYPEETLQKCDAIKQSAIQCHVTSLFNYSTFHAIGRCIWIGILPIIVMSLYQPSIPVAYQKDSIWRITYEFVCIRYLISSLIIWFTF